MNLGSSLEYTRDYNSVLTYFNSADKVPSSKSNTDFSISFLSTGYALQKVKKITLSSFTCMNLFNNVSSYNNVLGLYYSVFPNPVSIPAYITIAPGYYNATNLASAIQIQIQLNPALINATCSFDVNTYKFTIASNNPNIALGLAPVVVNNGFNSRLEGSLQWNIGFTNEVSAISASITADSLPSLSIPTIYIYSSKLSQMKSYKSTNEFSSTKTNLLLSIPMYDVCYGGIVNFTQQGGGGNLRGDLIYSIENQLDQVDFRLCDIYGRVLETTPNNTVQIEFFVHY